MDRRKFLSGVAAAGAIGLAGCSSKEESGNESDGSGALASDYGYAKDGEKVGETGEVMLYRIVDRDAGQVVYVAEEHDGTCIHTVPIEETNLSAEGGSESADDADFSP